MTGFLIDILLAIGVTIATVIADWLANLLVTSTRRLAAIKRVIEQSVSQGAQLKEIKKELDRYYSAKDSTLIWGSDLAAIAFSLDLAVLGIWVSAPSLFPFFSRFNSSGTSREIPVWLLLIFWHFILLLVSIILKHHHTDAIESTPTPQLVKFLKKGWFAQNKGMLASNAVGFIGLVSCFVVITNSI